MNRGSVQLGTATALPSQPAESPSDRKLAERIAMTLERDIIAIGWPVGKMFGREAELSRAYGVSRSIFREALAIVEKDGLLRTRRGRNGGLIVASPPSSAVTAVLRNYLEFASTSLTDLSVGRRAIEFFAIDLASERVQPSDFAALRCSVQPVADAESTLPFAGGHRTLGAILDVCDNPLLKVLTLSLLQLTIVYGNRGQLSQSQRDAYAAAEAPARVALIEAIIAGDKPIAYVHLEHLLNAQICLLKACNEVQVKTPNDAYRGTLFGSDEHGITILQGAYKPKLPEQLAAKIKAEILELGLLSGTHLGTQSDLLRKYHVGRGVLREAIRMLERVSLVEMERGRTGGLKVTTPAPESTIRTVCLYLRFMQIRRMEDVWQLAMTLGITLVSLAAEKSASAPAEEVEYLRSFGSQPLTRNLGEELLDYYDVLARIVKNPVLSLFMSIFANLYDIKEGTVTNETAPSDAFIELYRKVSDAILRGDPSLARRSLLAARRAINIDRVPILEVPDLSDLRKLST